MKRRFQGSLEYLIIIAAVLAISAIVVLFMTGAFGGSREGAGVAECKAAASRCASETATSTSASCSYCGDACIDNKGNDIMSGVPGCGEACTLCKQKKVTSITPAGESVYIINLHYENGVLSRNSIYTTLGFTSAPNTALESGVSAKIFSDAELYETRFELPDRLFYDNPEGPYPGGMIIKNETDFTMAMPYYSDAESIVFYNITSGEDLLSINVQGI